MHKRFTDCHKYQDPWFRKLPVKYKQLWDYMTCLCDNSGVWKCDFDLAQFQIGETFNAQESLLVLNSGRDEKTPRVVDLKNGRWLIPSFIKFQYGHLGQKSNAHLQVRSLIEENHLVLKQGLVMPSGWHQEQDKEQEKDQDIKGGVGGTEEPTETFNQLDAFRKFWPQYPARGRLNESASMRIFFQTVVNREIFSRLLKSLANYIAHLKANDWKQPQKLLNWLEEWPDWEKHQETTKEEDKIQELERRLSSK